MSGANKDAFFGAFYNTAFEKYNGTITVTRYGAEPQTYGIIAKQVSNCLLLPRRERCIYGR